MLLQPCFDIKTRRQPPAVLDVFSRDLLLRISFLISPCSNVDEPQIDTDKLDTVMVPIATPAASANATKSPAISAKAAPTRPSSAAPNAIASSLPININSKFKAWKPQLKATEYPTDDSESEEVRSFPPTTNLQLSRLTVRSCPAVYPAA